MYKLIVRKQKNTQEHFARGLILFIILHHYINHGSKLAEDKHRNHYCNTRSETFWTAMLIIVVQEQAFRINLIKAKINQTQSNSKFRIYKKGGKSINQILNKYSILAQNEYKCR